MLRLNKIRLINGTLRHYGLPQKPPGVSPKLDALKVMAHDALRGYVLDPLRKSERIRRFLRGLIYGRNANYYLEGQAKRWGGSLYITAVYVIPAKAGTQRASNL